MAWTVDISDIAEKQLKKLDKKTSSRIIDYLSDRLENCKNPRHFGEALKADKSGFWRYRVGDYRIICEIHEEIVTVLVIAIGHRKEIYKKNF